MVQLSFEVSDGDDLVDTRTVPSNDGGGGIFSLSVEAGEGADQVSTGEGDDFVDPGPGADWLATGGGDDHVPAAGPTRTVRIISTSDRASTERSLQPPWGRSICLSTGSRTMVAPAKGTI